MKHCFSISGRDGFTLVELVFVMAVAALIMALALPAFRHMGESSALTTSSLQVVDQLNLARQTALAENRTIEVRFYRLPDPSASGSASFRAMQLFTLNSSTATRLDKPSYFYGPCRLHESPTYTNLLATRADLLSGTGAEAGLALPEVGTNYSYLGFRFRPNGSTTLTNALFLTLVARPGRDATELPANWFAVQVDCVTGKVRSFRP